MLNRRRRRSRSNVYINIAPFVDVMLVLMVIFMMTSQISTVGVQVDLPKTTADNTNNKDVPIIITVDKNKRIYIEEAEISMEDLLKKLPAILKNGKSDIVYVRGDKNLQYGVLMDIMGVLSASGVCRVALIAEAKSSK